MKTDKPNPSSGKTRAKRGKSRGESWTERREKDVKVSKREAAKHD